tara:strand:+ start:754 stop:891 length:138 start_codon:yes stop_codon:yes gene_type:complete
MKTSLIVLFPGIAMAPALSIASESAALEQRKYQESSKKTVKSVTN